MRPRTYPTVCLALALGAFVTTPSSSAAASSQDKPSAQGAQEKPAAEGTKTGTLKELTSKAIEGVKPAPAQDPKERPEPKPDAEKPVPAPVEKPKAGTPDSAGPSGPDARAIANRMAAAVQVHEVRFARLDAVIAVFQQQNDTAKVERATTLKSREDQRYQAELATFKQALGDESYKKVLASLRAAKKGAGDAPKGGDKAPGKGEPKEPEKPGGDPAPAERKKGGGR